MKKNEPVTPQGDRLVKRVAYVHNHLFDPGKVGDILYCRLSQFFADEETNIPPDILECFLTW